MKCKNFQSLQSLHHLECCQYVFFSNIHCVEICYKQQCTETGTDMGSLCPPLITRTLPRKAGLSFVSKSPVEFVIVFFSLILEEICFHYGKGQKKKRKKLQRRKQKSFLISKPQKNSPNNFVAFSSKIFVHTCQCACMCVCIFCKV